MSSVQAKLTGETADLLKRMERLSKVEKRGVLNSLGEGLRTSTVRRFSSEKTPDGKQWEASARATQTGGKTLTQTSVLKTSIRKEVTGQGVVIGTNDIRAATHQFGDERTIRAKNEKYLSFKVGKAWAKVESVKIKIPARAFLGISSEDKKDIKETLEELFEE